MSRLITDSLRRYAKDGLSFSGGTFVSELRLPFAASFNIYFAAIDTGRVGSSELHRVIHGRHAAHLRHVKVERYGADIDRFARPVGKRQR